MASTDPTLAELKERLNALAREKAQLQLVALLMSRLGEVQGLEETIQRVLEFAIGILGGLNVTIFYRLDDAIHSADVHGRKEVGGEIEDDLVRQVFETRQFVSREREFSQTGMMTEEFTKATTWVMPLLVGTELVGVLRMDDLLVAGRELRDEVQTFLRYASLVLKNEISGEARLRRAFDEVSRATRAEAALAAQHSTLRGIIEGTTSPVFSLDNEYRYVAFNQSHVAAMRALYGAEIEVGRSMLDYMTVTEDREKARANLDRALAGEHRVESAYSGEGPRTRRYFEVAHHPVRTDDGQVVGVAVFANDVTERKRAEEERQTNLWIAESLDRVNRAIQGTQDLEQMMTDVLDAVLTIFDCDRAWLLCPCDPETASYRVPMERTRPEFPGALARRLEVPLDPETARVFRAARASTGPVTLGPGSEPPLPAFLTERFHVQSQIVMALYPKLARPYAFGLHQCSYPRIWTPEESRLFQDIGRRLSDALSSLLAHRELQESEKRYRRITESVTDYLYSVRVEEGRAVETRQGPACVAVTGYTAEELVADPYLWFRMVSPEDRELVRERVGRILSGEDSPPIEHRIVRKDGALRWVCDTTILLKDASGRLLSYDSVVKDVTERKRAEEALRESERRYRDIFTNVLDGLYLLEVTEDGRFKTIEVNPALERSTGIPRESVIGKTQEECAPEETARIVNAMYRRCVEAGRPIEEEVRLELPSGSRTFHSTLIPARDDSGRINRIIGISRDITDRKRAEEELARANRALRMLSESNQALIRVTDEATLLNEVCRIAIEVGGYRMAWVGIPEHDEAKTLRPVAHAGVDSGYVESARVSWADDERGRGPGGTAVRTGQPCIARSIPSDPSFAPWREAAIQRGYRSIIALPLVAEGRILGVLGIYAGEEDAFDSRETEILQELAGDLAFGIAALRTRIAHAQAEASLQLFRQLVDQSNDVIFVVDPATGQFLDVNDTGCLALGYTRQELLGLGVNDIDPTMSASGWMEHLKAVRTVGSLSLESSHRRKDGTAFPVEVSVRCAVQNQIEYLIAVIRDITERKKAERTLQESERRLRLTLEATQIGIWDWEVTTDRWYASPVYYTMLGYEPKTGLADRGEWMERVHPDDRACVSEKTRDVLSRDFKDYRYEARMRHADGTYRWQYVVGFGIERDQDGKVTRMLGIRMNIDERKRAEGRLRKEAERGSQLLDAFMSSPELSETDLYDQVLELAVGLTDSTIGFLHRVSDDQNTIILTTWNKAALQDCTAANDTHYPLDSAGNWVDCIRLRRPVVYNDFPASANQKGLPPGHTPVRRFMSVPVTEGDKVRIIFGVGNKAEDYDDGDVVQVQQIANELRKILKQRRAAEQVDFLNRLYRTISEINQVIVREKDRERLFAEVCRIGVEHGEFAMVWAGLVDVPGGTVRPVAAAGLEAGYVDELEIRLDAPAAQLRPAARAVLENRVVVVDDTETDPGFALWRQAAEQRGFRSCAAFPVHGNGVVRGVLKVYSGEPGVFHGEVEALLVGLAADLGYALRTLEADEQRKQAERDLRRSNELLRVIIDAAPTAIIGLDLDGNVQAVWNRAAERMLGWSAREVMGCPLPTVPVESQEEFARFRETIRSGTTLEGVEVRRRRRDGTPIDYSIYASPLRDPEGRIIGNIAVLVDINERKRLEVELRRLAAAIDQAAETIVVTDPQGVIQYVNPAFSRVTGYSREEAIGQNPRILKGGTRPPEFYGGMWATLARGEVWHGHFVNRRKDGSLFEEDATISPVRDESGRVVNYVAVKRDVTQEVALEEQLRQSQKMEAVGRLAGGVAHDFNNLLLVILGYTDLLLQQTHAADPRRARLHQIAAAADRAAGLTRQLLAFSRKQVLEPTILDLGALVRDLEKMLPRLLGEDVDLRISSAPQLGKVRADAGQIEQVIVNLAVNARDAMPRGGHLTIETTNVELDEDYAQHHEGAKAGPFVMLTVSDSGCGMSPETQRRIFEPFFTTKELGKGTGLGLSTVYGVVKQSNGHIWVYSEVGHGTTFKIYLPRVDDVADVIAGQQVDDTSPGGSETILLVEDDAAVRQLARQLLEAGGYTVLAAAGGAEALTIAEGHRGPVDLLLTDVVMPGMSGRDLARRLTDRRPEAKVLFMSGYTDEAIAHHGVLSPGTLLLAKPFTRATLGRKVREALGITPQR